QYRASCDRVLQLTLEVLTRHGSEAAANGGPGCRRFWPRLARAYAELFFTLEDNSFGPVFPRSTSANNCPALRSAL
ncbi:MAG: hypothetical protein ACREQ2_17080, partial [Candidatus Binatia bacterium]